MNDCHAPRKQTAVNMHWCVSFARELASFIAVLCAIRSQDYGAYHLVFHPVSLRSDSLFLFHMSDSFDSSRLSRPFYPRRSVSSSSVRMLLVLIPCTSLWRLSIRSQSASDVEIVMNLSAISANRLQSSQCAGTHRHILSGESPTLDAVGVSSLRAYTHVLNFCSM